MNLPNNYLEYPERHYGMDHSRYEWSDMFQRPALVLPNQAKIALWIMPILQWFPLNSPAKPFKAPGGLTMPYPDLRHYTNRDYGNRVGIFRLLDLLHEFKVTSSVAINSAIAERYPSLLDHILKQEVEIVAHGRDMGTVHYTGMEHEAEIIAESLQVLRQRSGQAVEGWLSPGRAQSEQTLDLLAQNNVRYSCDWANDDLPYRMRVRQGEHYSMPVAYETDDRVVQLEFFQNADEWAQQIKDRFDALYREAEQYGGRILSLPLHAWVSGVPYRIGAVREVLDYILSHADVCSMSGDQILKAFLASPQEI